MYIVFIILILIASALIILAVLAQNPKSGMAANFMASNQVMGARQTSDFLEKTTWGLAMAILVLSLGATMAMPKEKINASKSAIEKAIEQNAGIPGADALFPGQATESAPAETPATPAEPAVPVETPAPGATPVE